jgi:hypothetical protein
MTKKNDFYLNVILLGLTSMASKVARLPGTDSLVVKIPEMGNDILGDDWASPDLVMMVKV